MATQYEGKTGAEVMDKEPVQRPPDEELETIRLFLDCSELTTVSDEVREVVERYLPDLKYKLPPKPSLSGWVV